MIGRFDTATLELVAELSKQVAERLSVDSVHLCFATGPNADYHADRKTGSSLCFETEEDDTWAAIEWDEDLRFDIRGLLEVFMTHPDVQWMKQGEELDTEPKIEFSVHEANILLKLCHGSYLGLAPLDVMALTKVASRLDHFVDSNDNLLGPNE